MIQAMKFPVGAPANVGKQWGILVSKVIAVSGTVAAGNSWETLIQPLSCEMSSAAHQTWELYPTISLLGSFLSVYISLGHHCMG